MEHQGELKTFCGISSLNYFFYYIREFFGRSRERPKKILKKTLKKKLEILGSNAKRDTKPSVITF